MVFTDFCKTVIFNFQEGTDLRVTAGNREKKFSQPFLLKKNKRHYLVLDQKVLVAGDSFVDSFDRLFKAHYCFNVHFAQVLVPFYEYVAAYIYGMLHPSKVRTCSALTCITYNV